LHFHFLRLDGLDELELGAAAVEIVIGPMGAEIDIAFEMVC